MAAAALFFLLAVAAGGALLAAGVALALRCAPSAPPRLRYAMVLAACAASLVLPAVASRTSGPAEGRGSAASAAAVLVQGRGRGVTAPAGAGQRRWTPGEIRVRAEGAASALATGPAAPWLVLLWAAGATLLLAREAAGQLRLRARRAGWRPADEDERGRLSWPADIPLLRHPTHGPLAAGLLRPVVVLPDWMDEESARAAARHELEHALWRDPLASALLRSVRAALWPCPHLWYLERRAHAEREAAADRAGAGGGDVLAYAELLVRVARRSARPRMPSAAAHQARGELEPRIHRLLAPPAAHPRARIALAATVLAAGTAGAAAAVPAQRSANDGAPRPAAMELGREGLRYVNLTGAPLRVVAATALHARGPEPRTDDPVVVLRNPGPLPVTEFVVAFVRNGRVTAALHDSTDVAPGGSYTLRLPVLPGQTEVPGLWGAPGEMVVTVLEARVARTASWGTPLVRGRLPPVPPELALRLRDDI